jgi:hypothetical protein
MQFGSGVIFTMKTIKVMTAVLLGFFSIITVGCSKELGIQKLSKDQEYRATVEKLFTFTPEDPGYYIMQGGYFDGEKFYVAMIKKDSQGYELTKIHVLDKKGKIIKVSDILELDHANNITYNSKKKMFLVSHCQSPDDHYYRYSFVDPDTFEIIETADLPKPFFAMAYSEGRDMYASGEWAGETLDIWDGDLNLVKSVSVEAPGSLSQGVYCDDEYICFVRSSQNGYQAEIRVYDFDCNLVWAIPLDVPDGVEPENINIVKGKTYIMGNDWKNGCGVVYVVHFEEVSK